MQNTYELYKKMGYWFLLLIPLVVAGFYQTYFSVFFDSRPSLLHIHFTLMALWIIILITQPFLIRYKKLSLHRVIGKASYVLVPLLLISCFFVMRFSYYRNLNDLNAQVSTGTLQLNGQSILQEAADFQRITVVYTLWLAIFYILAIINKRKSAIHARYMVGAALTMLGPTVDRILFFYGGQKAHLFGWVPIETVAFFLQILVLGSLLIIDYRNKRPQKVLWTCISIYLTGHLLYFIVENKAFWESFISFIMKPAP